MYDSSDIKNLYQELIIDHGTHPRNFCHMDHADCQGEGYNPLCGDHVSLFVKISSNIMTTSSERLNPNSQTDDRDGIITKVTFQGKGCAISMASASLLTETVLGKTLHQAIEFTKAFQSLLILEDDSESSATNEIHLGKLTALSGVKAFPARVKCATLAWHAFLSALNSGKDLGHNIKQLDEHEESTHVEF